MCPIFGCRVASEAASKSICAQVAAAHTVSVKVVRNSWRLCPLPHRSLGQELTPLRDTHSLFHVAFSLGGDTAGRLAQNEHSAALSAGLALSAVVKFDAGAGEDPLPKWRHWSLTWSTDCSQRPRQRPATSLIVMMSCHKPMTGKRILKLRWPRTLPSLRQLFLSPASWTVRLQSCRRILVPCQHSNWRWTRCVSMSVRSLPRPRRISNRALLESRRRCAFCASATELPSCINPTHPRCTRARGVQEHPSSKYLRWLRVISQRILPNSQRVKVGVVLPEVDTGKRGGEGDQGARRQVQAGGQRQIEEVVGRVDQWQGFRECQVVSRGAVPCQVGWRVHRQGRELRREGQEAHSWDCWFDGSFVNLVWGSVHTNTQRSPWRWHPPPLNVGFVSVRMFSKHFQRCACSRARRVLVWSGSGSLAAPRVCQVWQPTLLQSGAVLWPPSLWVESGSGSLAAPRCAEPRKCSGVGRCSAGARSNVPTPRRKTKHTHHNLQRERARAVRQATSPQNPRPENWLGRPRRVRMAQQKLYEAKAEGEARNLGKEKFWHRFSIDQSRIWMSTITATPSKSMGWSGSKRQNKLVWRIGNDK